MKQSLFNILNTTGVSKLLRAQKKNKLTVLSLHRISNDRDFFWQPITPATFNTLLQYLVQYYTIISFSEISTTKKYSKPPLILSFDDGYYDFYEHALPLLIKYNLPSNHNIVNACATNNHIIWTQRLNNLFNHCRDNKLTSLVFSENDNLLSLESFAGNWMKFYLKLYNLLLRIPLDQRMAIIDEKEKLLSITTKVKMMNWNEIVECANNKVEIGCHTYNHDVLSTIHDSSILYHEIVASTIEIEKRLGKKINILSLPNGQGNELVHQMAAKAGINHVLYVEDKVNKLDKYTNANKVLDTYRINVVEESNAEMILRVELFHSKFRSYA